MTTTGLRLDDLTPEARDVLAYAYAFRKANGRRPTIEDYTDLYGHERYESNRGGVTRAVDVAGWLAADRGGIGARCFFTEVGWPPGQCRQKATIEQIDAERAKGLTWDEVARVFGYASGTSAQIATAQRKARKAAP